MLVIGDMLELGKFSKELHEKIIPSIVKIQPKVVITVGNFSSNNLRQPSKKYQDFSF